MASTAQNTLYATVKLRALHNGVEVSTGSGFFYLVKNSRGDTSIVLITNKHVIADADQLIASLHHADQSEPPKPKGTFGNYGMRISAADTSGIYPHPTADLVGLNFTSIYEKAIAEGFTPFLKTFMRNDIPTAEQWAQFDVLEEVTMIGCPSGIFDEHNNMPLMRRGITATALNRDYAGREEFMVDMACFPGSSGSPVVILNTGSFAVQGVLHTGERMFLVGVLYAGPLITNSGNIVMSQQPKVEVAAMMHLGQAIRSTAILAIEDQVLAQMKDRTKMFSG